MSELVQVPEDLLKAYLGVFGYPVDITPELTRAFKNGYRQGFEEGQIMNNMTPEERRRWGLPATELETACGPYEMPPLAPDAEVWMPTRDEVRGWLESKHAGTWGNFTVSETGRMEMAIDWLLRQIEELHEWTGR